MVDVVLDKGVEIDTQDDNETPSLQASLDQCNIEIGDKYEADDTSLHAAVIGNNSGLVYKLLDNGWAIDTKNELDLTPLHIAVLHNNVNLAKTLIDRGAFLDMKGHKGYTPLHIAVIKNNIVNIEMLIEKGANPDIQSNTGDTPLHMASLLGHRQTIMVLLANGAAVDLKNNRNHTPYQEANSNLYTKRIIAHHIAKLLIAGLPVADNQQWFHINHLVKLEGQCKQELNKMKTFMVYNNCPLSVVFTMCKNPYYLSDDKLLMCLEKQLFSDALLTEFPLYAFILKCTLKKSKKLYHLLILSAQSLSNLIRYQCHQLPLEIIQEILQYLDDNAKCQLVKSGLYLAPCNLTSVRFDPDFIQQDTSYLSDTDLAALLKRDHVI